ncbi:unannotated protein [freshwater metagenome]|uniref:Unannotated protein n=1 Tax=freshwater metagenome TaxID=449393 RepID=A0A6J7AYX4_9ZZZZ
MIAIGKSNAEPLLGNHAGDSDTVTFLFGQTSPLFTSAARTRSFDSFKAASGNPRSMYPGKPSEISTSTSIRFPVSPVSETLDVKASAITELQFGNLFQTSRPLKSILQRHQSDIQNPICGESSTKPVPTAASDKPSPL